ncbi:MAG: hypothetical protein Q8L37_04045 [Candidatus Gottesmanbacteria bacterium]|nr:hypothetical protein [Candidatus Gottesmanbacteria bacterium]
MNIIFSHDAEKAFLKLPLDRHHRASFRKDGDTLTIDALGPHDAGLGKK